MTAVARELGATPFDVPDVELTHRGPLCTFDTLLETFDLHDPALDVMRLIVRGADTASLDLAAEAAGLLAVSLGVSAMAGGNDEAALSRGFAI